MADITISRQDYNSGGTAQYNGWEPNTITGALTGTTISANGTATIPADFKDHKTVFIITAAADATVTFSKGDTDHGVNDLTVTAATGTTAIWLDSAKFVNKSTGKITVGSNKAITILGYEMR